MLTLVECPRDAMQGFPHQITTETKIEYLNQLLKVGFHTLDFGSFVSPKAVPQMADTAEVLAGLDLSATDTRLLAIVANLRGAEAACQHPEITYLGYPFSISETFQQRNTRKSIAESVILLKQIRDLCATHHKQLVVYLSMAFGNPYGDPWAPSLVVEWASKMVDWNIRTVALADTVGNAGPGDISPIFTEVMQAFPQIEIGAHFHATPAHRHTKLQAAWDAGCRRFDVAMQGFGGCPFAKDELVGNIATESLVHFCEKHQIDPGLDQPNLQQASEMAIRIFN